METTFHELLSELSQASEDNCQAVAQRLIERIRRMPHADQQELLKYTLARPRITPPTPYCWVPERTLVGLICHAVEVKTVSSPEEERLRAEIHASLLSGEPLTLPIPNVR